MCLSVINGLNGGREGHGDVKTDFSDTEKNLGSDFFVKIKIVLQFSGNVQFLGGRGNHVNIIRPHTCNWYNVGMGSLRQDQIYPF